MSHSRGKKDDIHTTPDVSHIQNVDVSHEESDVNVKGIASFIVGLAILIAVSMILMKLLYNFFEERTVALENQRPVSALAREAYNKTPPEPRLQAAEGWGVTLSNGQFVDLSLKQPNTERIVLQREWERQLKGGAVDPKTGFTTLPITEAMKQTVAQGLPAQNPQGAQQVDFGGQEMPSDSSSGRQLEK